MIFYDYLGFQEKLLTKAATCLEGWSPVHLGHCNQGVLPGHGGQVPVLVLQQRGRPIPLQAIHVYSLGLPRLPGAGPDGVGFAGLLELDGSLASLSWFAIIA